MSIDWGLRPSRWPLEQVELPKLDESTDIHFLDHAELEALLRSVPTDSQLLGPTDRALYLVAAMTGLRQGECGRRRYSPDRPEATSLWMMPA